MSRSALRSICQLSFWAALGWLLSGCGVVGFSAEPPQPMLFLVGDSTMAEQPPQKYPEQGWGQALPDFLGANIDSENHARNGHSTRSFTDEGYWQAVLERLQPGDFVVIGFGHNDQKSDDPSRYAAPWRAYRDYLETMVDDAFARGVRPILVTSIYRRQFNEEGLPEPSLGDYPEVTRAVAAERGVPLVDLNAKTRQLLIEEGVEGSTNIYMQIAPDAYATLPGGKDDNTHLQERGARIVAGLFVMDVKRQGLPLAVYFQ